MHARSVTNIAPGQVFVKSTLPGERRKTRSHRLPRVFDDHDAPVSVVRLFTLWVEQADTTDNGIIAINLRRQSYGHTTVAKAIRWLVSHNLLTRVESGGGRGVGSRFAVRWSFKYHTLTSRQESVNRPKPSDTVRPHSYRRKTREFISSCKQETGQRPVQHCQKPQLSQRAFRWAMARVREALAELEPTRRRWFIDAAAHAIRRATVRAGPQLAELVRRIVRSIRDGETAWVSWGRDAFSYVAYWTNEHLRDMRREHSRIVETEHLVDEIRRERERARRGFSEFLRPAGVSSLREYIARAAA